MSNIDLYIRDKDLDVIRRIGDDPHDMLTINERGQLCYHNLQNGGGCRTGEEPQDWYEFVPNEDMCGYNIDTQMRLRTSPGMFPTLRPAQTQTNTEGGEE